MHEYRGFTIQLLELGGYIFEGFGFRMKQDKFFPFKGGTDLESAKLHIDAMLIASEQEALERESLSKLRSELDSQRVVTEDLVLILAEILSGEGE